jgi:ADP compounds hydrolase
MNKKPDILKVSTLTKSKLFTIEQVSLSFQNNQQRDYERIVAPGNGAVLIVPVVNDSTLLMIREYCVGTHDYQLLFPKGRIDKGESIEQAANRELMEETGFAAHKLTHLKSMSIAPGYLDFITHIVIAEDLYEKSLDGDEPEPLQVESVHLNKFDELLQTSGLTEARSIASLYLVRDYLLKQTQYETS